MESGLFSSFRFQGSRLSWNYLFNVKASIYIGKIYFQLTVCLCFGTGFSFACCKPSKTKIMRPSERLLWVQGLHYRHGGGKSSEISKLIFAYWLSGQVLRSMCYEAFSIYGEKVARTCCIVGRCSLMQPQGCPFKSCYH